MARRAPPMVSGLLAALAALVRYAGISVGASVVLWELMASGDLKRRATRAAIAAAPTIVLQGGWTLYVSATSGPTSIRELGIYHGIGATLAEGGRTIVAWLAPTSDEPGGVRIWLGAVVAIIVGTLAALGVRRAIRGAHEAACGTLLACYVAVVVASRLVADAGIPFDERILSPLVLLSTIGIVIAMTVLWPYAGLLVRWMSIVAFSVWTGLSAAASASEAIFARTEGSDFANSNWRNSDTIAWTREHAADVPLYSNWPAALYFHEHRQAWMLPETSDSATLAAFVDTLSVRHGLVVAFDAPSPDVVSPDTIAKRVGLRVLARLRDGTIYRAPYGANEIIEP
jgi:hypothetical protein